jgi:hypothetical protein
MLKILSILGLFLIYYVYGVSQVEPEKGTILIKGTSNMKLVFTEGTPMVLGLGGGYFVSDNICVGADIVFGLYDGETVLAGAPFGRYYFLQKYFGGLSIIKPSLLIGGFPDDEENYLLSLEAGYIFSLNDNVSIEPIIKFPVAKNSGLLLDLTISVYLTN